MKKDCFLSRKMRPMTVVLQRAERRAEDELMMATVT